MKKMILWTIVLFTPLLWTTTAHAIFGIPDVAALAQRVTIIANQGTQIAQSVTQLARMREQFDKLKEQYDHIRQSTLGEIGALQDAFTDLSALPGQLVGAGLTWRADFAHTDAADLVDALDLFSNDGTPLTDHWRDRLRATATVTEADILQHYADRPVSLASRAATTYRQRSARGAERTAMNYAVNDAAAQAAATVTSALASYERLRAQTNLSPTALQQAQVAGLITSGEVSAAVAQLEAFQAAQAAADALAAEARRHALDAARLDAQRAARVTYDRRLAGMAAHSDGGEGLRLRMTALYGGQGQ